MAYIFCNFTSLPSLLLLLLKRKWISWRRKKKKRTHKTHSQTTVISYKSAAFSLLSHRLNLCFRRLGVKERAPPEISLSPVEWSWRRENEEKCKEIREKKRKERDRSLSITIKKEVARNDEKSFFGRRQLPDDMMTWRWRGSWGKERNETVVKNWGWDF